MRNDVPSPAHLPGGQVIQFVGFQGHFSRSPLSSTSATPANLVFNATGGITIIDLYSSVRVVTSEAGSR